MSSSFVWAEWLPNKAGNVVGHILTTPASDLIANNNLNESGLVSIYHLTKRNPK